MKTFEERRKAIHMFNDETDHLQGWIKQIEACDAILAEIDPDYEIAQIKEKFGTLRFYFRITEGIDYDWRELANLIGELEAQTAHLCQECGCESERQTRKHWITTMCDPCYEARETA